MIKVTGLWKNKGKDGKLYLSGRLGYSANMLILPNNYKKEEKDPDYNLFITEPKKREQQKPAETTNDDNIPF